MPRIQPFYLTVLAASVFLACLVCFPSILCADIYMYMDKSGLVRTTNDASNPNAEWISSAYFYKRDYNKSYKNAAEQGNANAQYILGVMYEKGKDVPQDFKEAVKWYKLAAEQGVAQAQFNMGML
ncbi:MAG TPA: hypothetical protein DCR95_02740, partial [Desulfobacter sp.]|nr:hypothetical protein [Desulfobacter sp.]